MTTLVQTTISEMLMDLHKSLFPSTTENLQRRKNKRLCSKLLSINMPRTKIEAFLFSVYRERSNGRIKNNLQSLYGKGELKSDLNYSVALRVLRERGELNWIK